MSSEIVLWTTGTIPPDGDWTNTYFWTDEQAAFDNAEDVGCDLIRVVAQVMDAEVVPKHPESKVTPANPTVQFQVISERCWNANQSWNYEKSIRCSGHVLRVSIRRNAYDEQSYARVETHNGAEWSRLVNWDISLCECKRVSYVTRNVTPQDFAGDGDRIFYEAFHLLGIQTK